MAKTIWTQNTQEFKVKWSGRKNLDINDVVDMLSDLFMIIENLEKK